MSLKVPLITVYAYLFYWLFLKPLQGLFGVPELNCPAGFQLATKEALKNTERLLSKACTCPPGVETVETFDQLSDGLCKVADLVSSPNILLCLRPDFYRQRTKLTVRLL